jgi:serine/threonine protein kinase
MSPEQLGGLPLSFSADVWSFGVVFWEMLTENLPWSDVPSDLWSMRKVVFEGGKHLPIPLLSAAFPIAKEDATAVTMLMKMAFLRIPASRPSMQMFENALGLMELQKTKVCTLGVSILYDNL